MNHKTYKKAAKRHSLTCYYIVEEIKKTNMNKYTRDHLKNNLYYLTGYILECIICYTYFNHVEINSKSDVYQSSIFKQIKSHDVKIQKQLINEIQKNCDCSQLSETPLFGGEMTKNDSTLYKRWSTTMRYKENNFSRNEIIGFYDCVSKIYSNLIRL